VACSTCSDQISTIPRNANPIVCASPAHTAPRDTKAEQVTSLIDHIARTIMNRSFGGHSNSVGESFGFSGFYRQAKKGPPEARRLEGSALKQFWPYCSESN